MDLAGQGEGGKLISPRLVLTWRDADSSRSLIILKEALRTQTTSIEFSNTEQTTEEPSTYLETKTFLEQRHSLLASHYDRRPRTRSVLLAILVS